MLFPVMVLDYGLSHCQSDSTLPSVTTCHLIETAPSPYILLHQCCVKHEALVGTISASRIVATF